jgi:hypothetical protein
MREDHSSRGDDDTLDALRKLQRLVPGAQEAHGLVMMLGTGLGEALTGVRARQARLELARAEARGSASVGRRRAEAEAGEKALTAVRAELRRLRVTEPSAGRATVGVYGHVLDGGDPVEGVQVALVDEDQALVCVDTDQDGSFALSQESDRPLVLRVSADDRVLHHDDDASLPPGPLATYRLVELGDAEVPRPEQYSCGDERPTPSQPPPKPGSSLAKTLKELRDGGARLAGVRLSGSDEATPKVTEVVTGDAGVALEVQGRTTDAGRLAVVATVLAHQPEAELAGVHSVSAATALLKAGEVTTWEQAREAAAATPAELSKRFGLARDQGTALAAALDTTMSTVEIAEEG